MISHAANIATTHMGEWLRKYHVAKRAYLLGACGRLDAVNALRSLHYGLPAAVEEVLDWARERHAVVAEIVPLDCTIDQLPRSSRKEPALIVAFDA